MTRRKTLTSSLAGLFVLFCGFGVLAGQPVPRREAGDPFDGAKMLADVKAYVDFGIHRTGTPGDVATRGWLVQRLEALGLKVELEPFTVPQFLLNDAHVVVGGKTVEAMAYWHPKATGATPLEGAVVFADKKSPPSAVKGKIAVFASEEAGGPPGVAATVTILAQSGAVGIVFTSRRGGLPPVMDNAYPPYVDRPTPVPVVIVSSGSVSALKAAEASGAGIAISITGTEVPTIEAANVIARVPREGAGTSSKAIVVSTPYSGWFTNAGERGPGIAILLGLAERAVRTPSRYPYVFVINSGHELNNLGADRSLDAGKLPKPEGVHAWLHLGASIGVVKHANQNGVFTPDLLEIRTNVSGRATYEAELRKAFASLPAVDFNFGTAPGEVANVLKRGYEVFGLIGGGRPFPFTHTRADLMGSVAPGHLSAVGRAADAALLAIEAR